MTEATVTELRAPDRTNAERQRRYRHRHPKRRRQSVTPGDALTVTPTPVTATALVTVTHPGGIASGAVLVAAVALAAVSGFFGVVGMTAIFAAAMVPVMVMVGVLEASKLATAVWLARHWQTAPLMLRAPLVVAVLALMTLTAIGTYGYLTRAHLAHQVESIEAIDRDAAPLTQRIALAEAALRDFDGRIAQLDDMVRAATGRGYTRTAMTLVGDQQQARAALVAQRQAAAERLAALKVQQAEIEAQRVRIAADAGPARYLAQLFGSNDTEGAIRMITALIVFTLDPLAVLLAIAASRRDQR
jgi:hypothetical protein